MQTVDLDGLGWAVCGDCASDEVLAFVRDVLAGAACIVIADPPYGNVLRRSWDRVGDTDDAFVVWMLSWVRSYADLVPDNGAIYVWGGLGTRGFRPFLKFLSRVEVETSLGLANVITWGKRRAYGVQHNYLFCREELAYLFKGPDVKKPRVFNVPLLDEKRGYAGYDERYPAKSEFKRRTNVWTDITELFSGKVHDAQKPLRTYEVVIQTHTLPSDWVIDPFAGSGTAAWAAKDLGRKFIVIEKDVVEFGKFLARWRSGERPRR
jgi:site-specific DNA-methyltransferase (adenine-specific)